MWAHYRCHAGDRQRHDHRGTDCSRQLRPLRAAQVRHGRTAGYRHIMSEGLAELDSDEILWRTDAYGSVYVVDRSGVDAILAAGLIPVIHLGVPAAAGAIALLTPHIDWLTVELTCTHGAMGRNAAPRVRGPPSRYLDHSRRDCCGPDPRADVESRLLRDVLFLLVRRWLPHPLSWQVRELGLDIRVVASFSDVVQRTPQPEWAFDRRGGRICAVRA